MKLLHTLLFLFFAFLATANPAGGLKSPQNSPHTSPSNQPGGTANYKAAQKHAKGQLQLDHTYAFNKGDRLSHTVLVVGKVVRNAAGELDFEATGFDITKYPKGKLNPKSYYGAICTTRTHEEWVCDAAKRYTFLGETQQLTQVEISEHAGAITEGNNCYNIATNNCKTWANKLWKDIKARDIFSWNIAETEMKARAMEERDMLGEVDEWQMGKRDMEQLYLYQRGAF
ncbi:hypothetical protein MMC18_003140 [Xylographa bjoerkii]|nr:hypothetical protein [Xylographa bjoerkii]